MWKKAGFGSENQKLYKLIKSVLESREQTIVRMRYRLSGNGGKTQREVAESLGISRSYVSRIEKKAWQNWKKD